MKVEAMMGIDMERKQFKMDRHERRNQEIGNDRKEV